MAYQKKAASFLTSAESFFNDPEFIPLKCELFSNLLVQSAESCFLYKSVKNNNQDVHLYRYKNAA